MIKITIDDVALALLIGLALTTSQFASRAMQSPKIFNRILFAIAAAASTCCAIGLIATFGKDVT